VGDKHHMIKSGYNIIFIRKQRHTKEAADITCTYTSRGNRVASAAVAERRDKILLPPFEFMAVNRIHVKHNVLALWHNGRDFLQICNCINCVQISLHLNIL
jgi:hypothetical protein